MKYQTRFIKQHQVAELSNLWHTSRIALAAQSDKSSHARMLWVANEFHKAHPEVSATAAYKDLCGMLGR